MIRGWHIITCEYPPQSGGVSDYTHLVAKGLADAGDQVHVWCPSVSGEQPVMDGMHIHPELGKISLSDLWRVGQHLDTFPPPRRLLMQWVPHGYGYKSMNLAFCLWLWHRAKLAGDDLDVMVHEPFLAFGEGSLKQDAVAVIHRIMVMVLLNAATRLWISIPAWAHLLRPYMLGRNVSVRWLPVPSNIECISNTAAAEDSLCSDGLAIEHKLGHFGTFGSSISRILELLIPPLLRDHANRCLIVMGRGSKEFRLSMINRNPGLKERIEATGEIPAGELSQWIQKCDLMIQPYPDGVSGRRTTAMVALSHGIPLVTTKGRLTEEVWSESGAVVLLPSNDLERFVDAVNGLLSEEERRRGMALRARQFYTERFALNHTIEALRSVPNPQSATCHN